MTKDEQLEAEIAVAKRELLAAKSPGERRVKWRSMRALIMKRSPEQVYRMEVAKGLRPAAPME